MFSTTRGICFRSRANSKPLNVGSSGTVLGQYGGPREAHELHDRFESCGEPKMELFDSIEVFYNQRRRHSTLGQISPAAFERRATQAA